MHMDGNQCLVLNSLKFGQVFGGLGNESVEKLQETIVGYLHNLHFMNNSIINFMLAKYIGLDENINFDLLEKVFQ